MAVRVLDKSLEEIPLYQLPADHFTLQYVQAYYRAGEYEKGNDLAREIIKEQLQELKYFWSISPRHQSYVRRDENTSKTFISILLDEATRADQKEFLREIDRMWAEALEPMLQRTPVAPVVPPDTTAGEKPAE
jgi:hypothetical protein